MTPCARGQGIRVRTGQIQLELGQLLPDGDGEAVGLTAMEVQLLRYLAERPGRAVPRGELLQNVWGYHPSVQSRAVDQIVKRLRRKIEADPKEPEHLLSEAGVGYRLVVTAPARRPAPRTPLLGRHELLAALDGWWEDRTRVAVLWGAGGIGKTHLARAWASSVPVPGGLHWIDVGGERAGLDEHLLSGLPGPGSVVERAAALGECLLVLDGVEGVLAEVEVRVRALQEEAPDLAVLLTTQTRPALVNAVTFEVPGLAADAARALFFARADAVAAGVASGDGGGVDRIVAATGGSPLALQWAASRVGLFAPTAIAERLERDDAQLWRDGLQRTMSWSWSLLSEEARDVLTRLACTFRGGFVPDAVLAVLDDGATDTFGALQELRDASWLSPEEGGRLVLRGTVRAFLADREARPDDVRRHGAWVVERVGGELAKHPWPAWRPPGPIDAERGNLAQAAEGLAALGASELASRADELGARLAGRVPGGAQGARVQADRAVQAGTGAARGQALRTRGRLLGLQGDAEGCDRDHLEAVNLALDAGRPDDAARTWLAWGDVANRTGRVDVACELFDRARRSTQVPEVLARVELELARAHCQRGDGAEALEALDRARPHLGALPLAGLRWSYTRGYVELELGRYADARARFAEALRWAGSHDRPDLVDLLQGVPVSASLLLGDLADARAHARKSRARAATPFQVAEDELQLAHVAQFEGDERRAEEHARGALIALRRPRGALAVVIRGTLARTAAQRGDVDTAQDELAEALRWAPEHIPDARALGLVQRALVASALGEVAAAHRHANEAVTSACGGPRRLPGEVRLGLALLEREGNLSATADPARRR